MKRDNKILLLICVYVSGIVNMVCLLLFCMSIVNPNVHRNENLEFIGFCCAAFMAYVAWTVCVDEDTIKPPKRNGNENQN